MWWERLNIFNRSGAKSRAPKHRRRSLGRLNDPNTERNDAETALVRLDLPGGEEEQAQLERIYEMLDSHCTVEEIAIGTQVMNTSVPYEHLLLVAPEGLQRKRHTDMIEKVYARLGRFVDRKLRNRMRVLTSPFRIESPRIYIGWTLFVPPSQQPKPRGFAKLVFEKDGERNEAELSFLGLEGQPAGWFLKQDRLLFSIDREFPIFASHDDMKVFPKPKIGGTNMFFFWSSTGLAPIRLRGLASTEVEDAEAEAKSVVNFSFYSNEGDQQATRLDVREDAEAGTYSAPLREQFKGAMAESTIQLVVAPDISPTRLRHKPPTPQSGETYFEVLGLLCVQPVQARANTDVIELMVFADAQDRLVRHGLDPILRAVSMARSRKVLAGGAIADRLLIEYGRAAKPLERQVFPDSYSQLQISLPANAPHALDPENFLPSDVWLPGREGLPLTSFDVVYHKYLEALGYFSLPRRLNDQLAGRAVPAVLHKEPEAFAVEFSRHGRALIENLVLLDWLDECAELEELGADTSEVFGYAQWLDRARHTGLSDICDAQALLVRNGVLFLRSDHLSEPNETALRDGSVVRLGPLIVRFHDRRVAN